jgi:hypothetical protein
MNTNRREGCNEVYVMLLFIMPSSLVHKKHYRRLRMCINTLRAMLDVKEKVRSICSGTASFFPYPPYYIWSFKYKNY